MQIFAQQQNGKTVTLKSHHGKYLSAQQEGTAVAIVDAAGDWEKWTFVSQGDDGVDLRSNAFNTYLAAEPDGTAGASHAEAGPHFKLRVVQGNKITLQGSHGKFLVAEPDGTLNANREEAAEWETFEVVAE